MSTTTDEKILANNNDDKNGRSDDLISEPDKKSSTLKDFCGLSIIQSKIVSWGITSIALCAIALLVTIIAFLCNRFFTILSPAIMPLVLGLFLSFTLRPFTRKITEKLSEGALGPVYWIFWFLLFVVVIILLVALGSKLVEQITYLVSNVPKLYEEMKSQQPKVLRELIIKLGGTQINIPKEYWMWVLDVCVTALKSLSSLSTWFFAIFFSYCFLKMPSFKAKTILEGKFELQKLPALSGKLNIIEKMIDDFTKVMTMFLPKQILINFFEGIVGGGLLMMFLPSGFVLGFIMGFMNIIPFYGTFAMLPVVLIVAYLGGDGIIAIQSLWLRVGLTIGIWMLISLIFDQLAPHIFHKKDKKDGVKLSSGAIVFSFLFWGALISPTWGMILAIPLSSFTVTLWEDLKQSLQNRRD